MAHDDDRLIMDMLRNMRARIARLEALESPVSTSPISGAIATIQGLPSLRLFVPFSSVDESGNAYDVSGQGRMLTNTGAATYGVDDTAPYTLLNGTTQYFIRPDEAGLDITGALTIGGWFYATALVAANYYILTSKSAGAGARGYAVYIGNSASSVLNGQVSSDGTATTTVTTAGTLAATTWYFIAMRYTPSTELAIFYAAAADGATTKTVNTTAIPAASTNNAQALTWGARSDATSLFGGRIALAFLCASALSDTIIDNLYQSTRGVF